MDVSKRNRLKKENLLLAVRCWKRRPSRARYAQVTGAAFRTRYRPVVELGKWRSIMTCVVTTAQLTAPGPNKAGQPHKRVVRAPHLAALLVPR